eukprot:8075048-Pyramimonas_sp.AAC.1
MDESHDRVGRRPLHPVIGCDLNDGLGTPPETSLDEAALHYWEDDEEDRAVGTYSPSAEGLAG